MRTRAAIAGPAVAIAHRGISAARDSRDDAICARRAAAAR